MENVYDGPQVGHEDGDDDDSDMCVICIVVVGCDTLG